MRVSDSGSITKRSALLGRKIERDGEHGADGAGMHDEDRLACRQQREPRAGTRDLIDKTFAAGRPVACGDFQNSR